MRSPYSRVATALMTLDAATPGAVLQVGPQPAVVEAFEEVSGGLGPALSVNIAESSHASENDAATGKPGFTAEEELFRTRWGWAAFEATRRAARETDTSI